MKQDEGNVSQLTLKKEGKTVIYIYLYHKYNLIELLLLYGVLLSNDHQESLFHASRCVFYSNSVLTCFCKVSYVVLLQKCIVFYEKFLKENILNMIDFDD